MTSEQIILQRSGGRCEAPECSLVDFRGFNYAHISHKKMGGRHGIAKKMFEDPRNKAYLCCPHHDILDERVEGDSEGLMLYLKEKIDWDEWYEEARQGGINV